MKTKSLNEAVDIILVSKNKDAYTYYTFNNKLWEQLFISSPCDENHDTPELYVTTMNTEEFISAYREDFNKNLWVIRYLNPDILPFLILHNLETGGAIL